MWWIGRGGVRYCTPLKTKIWNNKEWNAINQLYSGLFNSSTQHFHFINSCSDSCCVFMRSKLPELIVVSINYLLQFEHPLFSNIEIKSKNDVFLRVSPSSDSISFFPALPSTGNNNGSTKTKPANGNLKWSAFYFVRDKEKWKGRYISSIMTPLSPFQNTEQWYIEKDPVVSVRHVLMSRLAA